MPARATILFGVLLTALVAMGPISTDMYLPSMPILADTFGADPERVQLTLSLFLAGFAVGQLVYGPLSDRFGRRWVLFGGICLFFFASAACALAQSIDQLIAARFLQALGACAGPVLARAVVRDLFGRERAATILAYIGTAMGLIPAVAPILGGYLTVWFGWQGTFIVLTFVGGVLALGVVTVMYETNQHRDPAATRIGPMIKNYRGLLADRAYLGYVLSAAFAFSGVFAFLAGSPFVLINFLGVAVEDFGLYFSIIVFGYMTGTILVARLTPRFGLDTLILSGVIMTALSGLMGAALALFWEPSVGTIIGPQFTYMVGLGIILPNAMAGAIAPFPRKAGVASALLGFMQMSLAAATGIVAGAFDDGTHVPMITSIFVTGILALIAFTALTWRQHASASKRS